MGNHLVSGYIVFDPAPVDLTDARIFIRLEDTTYAGRAANVIVEHLLTNLPGTVQPDQSIPFELDGAVAEPRHRYTVTVHVVMGGASGQSVSPGDYINRESYPVLTFGYPK